ncbi:MAG: tRNA pseudouridine(38-40) synthase TruA [Actinobacteria bacterium]|nr:MAG: tRNA pseudouridine(38-40) synthase TruA [Actinomycetota bacterium]
MTVTALTVAYDGAPFAGFARQSEQRTVQGTLEDALRTVLRREVETVGAGRTDAGVHALGQVVSFESAPGDPDAAALARSLNALCAPHVAVREVRAAREGFSARFDAEAREYRYRIAAGAVPPVLLAPYAWHVARDLDAPAVRRAAAALVGEHDFRSFCVADSAEGKNTVRTLTAVELYPAEDLGEPHLVLRVVGTAFLHSMVRVIAGSLVEIGRGARDEGWLGEALAARDRAAAGPTAPAHGLTLWDVAYPGECWV